MVLHYHKSYTLIEFFFFTMGKHVGSRLQWSIKNWRFEEWFNNTLKNNTIRCKKFATIVSGRKNVARLFFRRKQVSTSAKMQQQRSLFSNNQKKLLHTLLNIICLCILFIFALKFKNYTFVIIF